MLPCTLRSDGSNVTVSQDVSQPFSQGPLTQGMSMSQAFQMSQPGMSGLSQAELSQVSIFSYIFFPYSSYPQISHTKIYYCALFESVFNTIYLIQMLCLSSVFGYVTQIHHVWVKSIFYIIMLHRCIFSSQLSARPTNPMYLFNQIKAKYIFKKTILKVLLTWSEHVNVAFHVKRTYIFVYCIYLWLLHILLLIFHTPNCR